MEEIQNINSINKSQFSGVIPVRTPIEFTNPVILANSYRISIVISPGSQQCALLTTSSEPLLSTNLTEWSLLYLGKVGNQGNFMLYMKDSNSNTIDYVNFVVTFTDDIKFIIEREGNQIYIFDENSHQIFNQQVSFNISFSLLYAFFQVPSSDTLCKSFRIFTDLSVKEIIDSDSLNPYKVLSLVIRQSNNLIVDYSLFGLTSNEWQDFSKNGNNLTGISSVKINYPYPQEHSILQGRNPFISSHKITQNQHFNYTGSRTGELSVPLQPEGDIKFIRTKISSVLPTDSTGKYQSVDSLILPTNFTILYHLMFKGDEGKVMEMDSNPEDTVEVNLNFIETPDDKNWHQVAVIKDGDTYSLYLDSVKQDTFVADLPVLEIDGLLSLNNNSGNLISVSVFDYPFSFEDLREVYNGSFILSHTMSDQMKSHLIYDFNSEGMYPQNWSDNVQSLTAFSSESLRVLEVPDVQGVNYSTLQYPR